jgi:hypothetical protein
MARPLKVTPERFDEIIDKFLVYCEESGEIPSDWALIKFAKSQGADISPGTLDRYYMALNGTEIVSEGDGKERDISTYKPFGNALKKLVTYRQHWATTETINQPKLAGHTAFVLKQPRWGGWSDKQEQSQDIRVDVKLSFDDGK